MVASMRLNSSMVYEIQLLYVNFHENAVMKPGYRDFQVIQNW